MSDEDAEKRTERERTDERERAEAEDRADDSAQPVDDVAEPIDVTDSDGVRDRANTSRRRILQGVAAGSLAGVTGFGSAQDTTTEQETTAGQETTTQAGGQRQSFFERGTEVGVQMVADGQLTAPTDFAVAQGQNQRQYVTDQTGQVYVITQNGLRDEPFMDITDRMVELGRFYGLYADAQQNYDERGLLGIDFHPNFQENRRFYLHYSAPPTDELRTINWDHIEVVSEFQATEDFSSGNPDSERQLLRIPSPQYNHDAGPMAFGPDGYLYVPMGDGGGANDNMYGHVPDWYEANTGGNGQDIVHNLLGDVLRIDVDSQGQNTPYGIPEDNPFAGEAPGRDEIYAYGFRNPFGISFDSQGNMFVADAGQNLWEEANVVERGGNYGWNVKEGTHCFSTERPSTPGAITDCPSNAPDQPYGGEPLRDPIVEFPHEYRGNPVGITVIGGHRYEQPTISGLQGKYVFGAWTEDPLREEPAGRILAAAPPQGFDGGGQTTGQTATEAGRTTPGGGGTTAEGGETTVQEAALQDETTTANGTATVEPAEGENVEKAPAETGTPGETTTAGGQENVPPEGPQVVPRDRLWDMEELVIRGGFDWFVRMFGRGADGEIYVLVNKRGVPEGDTGAVLKLVPPGQGDGSGAGQQTTTSQTTTGTAGTQTGGDTGEGGTTTDAAGDRSPALDDDLEKVAEDR
ncbi:MULTISPECIES: PQQ-dependent sugar dehydrogenase [Halorussus]|uniref:PQQ-dependent sugar dehydrogenase n=1 Tax=Halorussus TaxID=1070314 RepID=UPI0020A1C2FC|nr:PQQ-dependent sugar dehydrogenase [Halorussus vallis]USZ77630.1 PQQ-dependent sugar dehydrogenase [Halorussus vallis]